MYIPFQVVIQMMDCPVAVSLEGGEFRAVVNDLLDQIVILLFTMGLGPH